MKIKLKIVKKWCFYRVEEKKYTQKQFDYVFKYLNFDKLETSCHCSFNDKNTEKWFHETYIYNNSFKYIRKKSPEGYQYLKDHWGKGVFKTLLNHTDKQELKTIVNRLINIELIRNEQ